MLLLMLMLPGSPVTARTVSANLSVMVMMRVFSATNLQRATAMERTTSE
jgi:hypothetical protein